MATVGMSMSDRITVDFQKALTNVEDGLHAVEVDDDQDNIDYFVKEAKSAFDGVPSELPYVEDYRQSLDDEDFESAFDALANFASYVEAGESEEYEFSYQQLALERVHDSYREEQ